MSDSIAVLSHYVSFELPFCIAEVPEMERTAITGTAARTLKEACTKKKKTFSATKFSETRVRVCSHTASAGLYICIYLGGNGTESDAGNRRHVTNSKGGDLSRLVCAGHQIWPEQKNG